MQSPQIGADERLILVLGGARSGKSTFAEQLARRSGRSVAFIATSTASDDEMRARIAHHQATRPAEWHTIEEPLRLADAVHQAALVADVLLLDCMTLWLSNWLLHYGEAWDNELSALSERCTAEAIAEITALLEVLTSLEVHKRLIVVSNEVGLGVVPAYALGRLYRDTLGYVNQRLASSAAHVYLMVAGLAVDIKRLHEEASLSMTPG